MDHIERAMEKKREASLIFIVDPDVVKARELIREQTYAKEAAKELAEASIVLNAITQPEPVVETVFVEHAPTAWEYVRNTLIALMLLAVAVVSVGWAFNVGWVLGNEHHQNTIIDQAPDVTGPLYDFNREQGKRE